MNLYPKIQILADLNNIIQVYFIIYEIIICFLRDDYVYRFGKECRNWLTDIICKAGINNL
jgi:hypothetical protein